MSFIVRKHFKICPDMTLAVDHNCKALIQTNKHKIDIIICFQSGIPSEEILFTQDP